VTTEILRDELHVFANSTFVYYIHDVIFVLTARFRLKHSLPILVVAQI